MTLLYDCIAHHNSFFHGFYGFEVTFQNIAGDFTDLQPVIEHQQGVVYIGYTDDYLRLYGLLAELYLFQGNLYLAFGVQQLAEQADLLTCRHWE